ncbi:MAG: family 16 glycosylhydrolase [Verrucomicrobiaceae bacterium]
MLRVAAILLFSVSVMAGDELPVKEGLRLWLDASAGETLTKDGRGRVGAIRSRVGEVKAEAVKAGPTLKPDGLGGKAVMRFNGHESLRVKGVLEGVTTASVFIVFQRGAEFEGKKAWQKLMTNEREKEGVFLHTGGDSPALAPKVWRGEFEVAGPDLLIGSGNEEGWGELWGDIAEVLVYDRGFYVAEPINEIVGYLEKKWSFQEDRSNDWALYGPLPKVAERTSDKLPLSDQANAGKWETFELMWDEFEGEKLDETKWWDHNPNWYGRAPGRFLPREVVVKEGELRLTMRKDPSLEPKQFYKGGEMYRDYSSGTIKSKEGVLYGYFEIEAQAMASAGSSAWWFSGTSDEKATNGRHRIEIDVFELGGKSEGREHTYSMNLHVFESPESKRHWSQGAEWEAPFEFAKGFHVFGLEWTKEFIRYYVDGALVRSVKNTAWHAPQHMIFDSETMGSWLGMPKDEDLPSVFRVKWVRAWKNAETRGEWEKDFDLKGPKGDQVTGVTRYLKGLGN